MFFSCENVSDNSQPKSHYPLNRALQAVAGIGFFCSLGHSITCEAMFRKPLEQKDDAELSRLKSSFEDQITFKDCLDALHDSLDLFEDLERQKKNLKETKGLICINASSLIPHIRELLKKGVNPAFAKYHAYRLVCDLRRKHKSTNAAIITNIRNWLIQVETLRNQSSSRVSATSTEQEALEALQTLRGVEGFHNDVNPESIPSALSLRTESASSGSLVFYGRLYPLDASRFEEQNQSSDEGPAPSTDSAEESENKSDSLKDRS